MTYTAKSKVNPTIEQREREMLLAGFNYVEVAQALRTSRKVVASRNQVIYKINLQETFARRIERDGIPPRLNVSDAFGYWMAGFFDGEGHLGVFSRPRLNGYFERRLIIQIMLRDDDASVIAHIKHNLNVGLTYAGKANGSTNPKATFRCEQIQDLAEVIVPLFEKYPLYSKKSREFVIWKELVRRQYIFTLGGHSQRVACSEADNAIFDKALQAIKEIRTYRNTPLS